MYQSKIDLPLGIKGLSPVLCNTVSLAFIPYSIYSHSDFYLSVDTAHSFINTF